MEINKTSDCSSSSGEMALTKEKEKELRKQGLLMKCDIAILAVRQQKLLLELEKIKEEITQKTKEYNNYVDLIQTEYKLKLEKSSSSISFPLDIE